MPEPDKHEPMALGQPGDFTKLGSDVYILRAPSFPPPEHALDPTLILIFGWMAAKLPHIQKYTQIYRTMYPYATQLLMCSQAAFFFQSKDTQRHILSPAVTALEACGYIVAKDAEDQASAFQSTMRGPRILIHTFSNGGAYVLSTFSGMLSKYRLPTVFPPAAMIPSVLVIDSAPGDTSLRKSLHAFTVPLRNPFTRLIASVVLVIAYLFLACVGFITGAERPDTFFRRMLHKPDLLPWTTRDTARLYVYSQADELVSWEAVQAHAAEAKGRGFRVQTEIFKDSHHVAHMRADHDRYWGTIRRVWDSVSSAYP
ncbi:hypothetical protein OF83DRAFT_1133543 [Amylostereum chailletii]|nr:hypothetical protein OF83DRAFT_1135239 [Amylostereum chailletii]KAI0315126.1 hypothetical protein OF83DRAFT_1133543 [Amylostereum chailletii]